MYTLRPESRTSLYSTFPQSVQVNHYKTHTHHADRLSVVQFCATTNSRQPHTTWLTLFCQHQLIFSSQSEGQRSRWLATGKNLQCCWFYHELHEQANAIITGLMQPVKISPHFQCRLVAEFPPHGPPLSLSAPPLLSVFLLICLSFSQPPNYHI